MLAVTAIAGVIRFTNLSRPPELFFDENYYAKSGCILIGDTDRICLVDSNDERYWRENKWDVGSWVHPPLGKWTIGMGEKVFGVTPFGWRFSSALAGTLVVTIVAIIAQLLFGERALDVRRRPALGDREPQRRAVAIGAARHPPGVLGARRGSCSCCWTGDGSTDDRHPNRSPTPIWSWAANRTPNSRRSIPPGSSRGGRGRSSRSRSGGRGASRPASRSARRSRSSGPEPWRWSAP